MAYEVKWYVTDRIVYARCYDDYTLDELASMTRCFVDDYLNAADSTVHLLVDLNDMDTYPVQVARIRDVVQDSLLHPNMGWLLVYGVNNPMLAFIIKVATQVMRTRVRQINELDEAISVLQIVDSSLLTI